MKPLSQHIQEGFNSLTVKENLLDVVIGNDENEANEDE